MKGPQRNRLLSNRDLRKYSYRWVSRPGSSASPALLCTAAGAYRKSPGIGLYQRPRPENSGAS